MGFALKLAKTPKEVINEKVEEAARILDLTQHLDRRPANLSGGQRQRVAMGRAIVRDPAAFLMDEPLSNLDAKLRVQTRTEVSRLQKRLGTTMVYVTHDQTEAMTLGDKVAVMRLDVLQQVASPQELYDEPVNLFVAGFIGSPSMNFMAGGLEDDKLRTGVGDFPLTPHLRQELDRAGTGRDVIVGIRPENFEDAAIVPAEVRANGIEFNASVDVVESLGSEKFVYFTRELGKTTHVAELEELAKDSGRADTGGAEETVVARLDPASRLKEGEDARLWVDVRKLHVFDPSTGRNLSLAATGAPGAAAPAAAAGAGAADATGKTEAADRAEQASATADPASGTDSR
jgi:multiple sugar transport system ATP-binding protein